MNEISSGRELPRWFVLQGMDPVTGCAVLETRFLVDDLAKLREILGPICQRDADLEWEYPLEPEQLAQIDQRFGASLAASDYNVMLVPWHSTRQVPYLIHTGFELPLMLEGRKPFAKFSDAYPSAWFDEFIARFDPFVEDGRIIRRILTRPFEEAGRFPNGDVMEGVREVFFALPGQEWRIDAYLLLVEVGSKTGWNHVLERYEGALLGYEDWQSDWWINHLGNRWKQIEPLDTPLSKS